MFVILIFKLLNDDFHTKIKIFLTSLAKMTVIIHQ